MDEITSVLIVDDDEIIREYLKAVIEKMGYSTASAADGIEALQYLQENPNPDLILLDVIMPEMTGLEVLRKIKEDPVLKAIIVIMVTGVHHISEKELAFMLGASDYLEKPFETRELVARVRTHINLKKATEKCVIQRKIQETILSTVPGIVYMKSRDGTYIHANEMFGKLVGKPIDIIVGMTELDLFPESVASERTRTDELILRLGVPELEMQEEITSQNGETRYFFTRKRPVLDNKSQITGLVGVSIDITEQVILKEAYFEKEELLTAILNTYPAEIWVLNLDKEMILQNNDHLLKYGTLIGQKLDLMPISQEIRTFWESGYDEALIGRTKIQEHTISEPAGIQRKIQIITPVHSDEKVLGVMGMNLNVTRWKGKESETDLPADSLMPIIDHIPEPVFGFDISTESIQFTNRAAQQVMQGKSKTNVRVANSNDGGITWIPINADAQTFQHLRIEIDNDIRDVAFLGTTRFENRDIYLFSIIHTPTLQPGIKPELLRKENGM